MGSQVKARIPEIDILRGFAIILVVLGHSFITNPINIHDLSWGISLRHWIYTFHMELFFVLAGCVYQFSYYRSFIKKKTERILVPYLFFGLLAVIIHSVGLEAVNGHTSFKEGIIKLLLFGGDYWFLYVLFIIFCIYPLIETIFKWYLEVLLAVVCLLFGFFPSVSGIFRIESVLYHLPFLFFGRLIGSKIPLLKKISVGYRVLLLITSLVLYFLLDVYWDDFGGNYKKFIRAVFMIIALFYISVWMVKEDSKSVIIRSINQFLTICSRYSLQIYLFNGFLMVPIRVLLCNVLHISNPFAIVLAIVAGNLVISIIVCQYLISESKMLSYLCGINFKKIKYEIP